MHEGFKDSSNEDTEIISYILDLRNMDLGETKFSLSDFNLLLLPQ